MPSLLHEALLMLFRNRPALAPELLRDTLHISLPDYTDVRIDSADLTNIQPAEYRADMVALLLHGDPVLGIVLEMQLGKDENKRYAWPAYVVNLRARIRCPVRLFVIAAEESVARWASKAIDLGGDNWFKPCVLRLSEVPEVTNEEQARRDPELAVLSTLGHADDRDPRKSASIALAAWAASVDLEVERSKLYCDLVWNSLSEAARRALSKMDAKKYEYQSEFARRYVAQGRMDLLLKLLSKRYGAVSAAVATRIRKATASELDAIAERVLTANTLDEALGIR